MSALGRKVLDLAEQQGLLDGKSIAELRQKVAESKYVISPEAIAKVLVDHGHLTPFQARKLVSQALGNEPDPVEKKVAEKQRASAKTKPLEDLTLADDERPPSKAPRPAANESIVDLELVEEPVRKSPSRGKPSEPNPFADDDLGATAEDYVDLEPVDPTPAARGQRWKTDSPSALNETIEMSPLDLPSKAAPGPEPIDDLFELEPVPAKPALAPSKPAKPRTPVPADDLFATPPLQPLPTPRIVLQPQKSVWDSPLLLIGGGLLGVTLVAFALLFYALTRGTAAELFNKAEEEYQGGSFASASAMYEQFLKKYPQDANASLARVRRQMATLRQITDAGNNPRLGLETAQQVLPQIEREEKFSEARPELSSILPTIAEGLATRAQQTDDPPRKQEWVKLAGDALALVNNPAYLPASLRQEREGQISRVVDRLKVAERGIQQDKDLARAIETIVAAADKGQAGESYRVRSELLRIYPGLEGNAELVAAIRKVGEKERELVQVTKGGPAALTADHPVQSETVILSERSGSGGASTAGMATLLLEGAVYGVDVASGRLLWRRYVGYESAVRPVEVALGVERATAIIDARQNELALVDSKTGTLRWRQPLNDEALGLVTKGNRLYVTTRKGRVVIIDAARGEILSSAQLPQGVAVGPALYQSRIFQLGEHSTLFVLDADSLTCVETLYLGHSQGTLLVAPVGILDNIVLIESPTDDYSTLQLIALDAKSKKWSLAGSPKRLKGRVVNAPGVSAARLAITTDLGQVSLFQLDSGSKELRQVAAIAASETEPLTTYAELDKTRLWVTSRRRTMYEIQEALQQLSLKWTENHDDRFVAPPHLHGDVLVTARRRSGMDSVLLEGCHAGTGQTLWTTRMASAVVAALADQASGQLNVLTRAGQLFSLGSDMFQKGIVDQTAFASAMHAGVEAAVSADGQSLAWSRPHHAKQSYLLAATSKAQPIELAFSATLAAPPVPVPGGLVSPLTDGRVLLESTDKAVKIGPFMPPLMPNALPRWTQPAVTSGSSFLISDGRATVFAVARKDQPEPRLEAAGQTLTSDPVTHLVWAGSWALGIVRQESTDAVIGFDDHAAVTFAPVPLEGRIEAGPFAVGGLVLLSAEPAGFVCIASDGKTRWQRPLDRGPLAGAPLAVGGDLLVALQSGDVCRLDPATGKELGHHSIHQPLYGPLVALGGAAVVCGSDGVIHRIEIPPRESQGGRAP